MNKKLAIVGIAAVLLLIVGAWCLYAVAIPDQTLAGQSRCSRPVRIQAIDATRHLFGRKTSSEIETDILKQYPNPLQLPPKFSCAN